MASGTWCYVVKTSSAGGNTQSTAFPPSLLWVCGPAAAGFGSFSIQFEPAIWLYDDVLLTWTEYLISELPPGFQILTVEQSADATYYYNVPAIWYESNLPPPDVVTSWSSSISGWGFSNPTLADKQRLLETMSLDIDFYYDTGGGGSGGFAVVRMPGYALDSYPTPNGLPSFFCPNRTLFGTWDDLGAIGATPGVFTPTVVPTGIPNQYTVGGTPGPNTTIVQIVTPTEVLVIPVGNLPVLITTTGPTITITPINTIPSVVIGPPVIILIGTFDYTMVGGIDLGGTPTLQFIGNPSGIYTLVQGKTNDTLLERIPASGTQDVKIPDPFIKTAFFGE